MTIDLAELRKDPRSTRRECQTCPARGGVWVPPNIHEHGKGLLVGERPGRQEMIEGEVFIGPAGNTLDLMLEKAGSHRRLMHVANAVACGLPDNPTPTGEEMAACAGVLERVIEAVQPPVIVALGGVATQRLLGLTKPTQWRGSVIKRGTTIGLGMKKVLGPAVFKSGKRKGELKPGKQPIFIDQTPGTPVIVTLHPAELRYTGFRSAPMFIADLQRARLMIEDPDGMIEVGALTTGRMSNEARFEQLLSQNDQMVLDVETEHTKVVGAGKLEMIGISLGTDHGESFEPTERNKRVLQAWMGDERHVLVGQNLSFDVKVLEKWMAGIAPTRCKLWDTMHASHFERSDLPETLKPKALDTILSRIPYVLYTNWKQMFRDGLQPNAVLYNQLDCAHTWVAWKDKENILRQTGRLAHFTNVMMPALRVLIKMEQKGVMIDRERLGQMREEQARLVAELEQMWETEAPGVNQDSTARGGELQKFFYETLKLPVQHKRGTETVTLDKDALEHLAKLRPDCRALRVLVGLRHAQGILTKYLDLELDERGYLHPQYNMSGAVTGRLSSGGEEGFNFQNIPRVGEKCKAGLAKCCCINLRELFTSTRGVVVGDWSQIEYRVTALLAHEDWLIEAYRDRAFDIHADAARKLGVPRSVAKNIVHASNYGAGALKVAQMCRAGGFQVSQEQTQAFLTAFQATRPRIHRWQIETIGEAKRRGYISNPFGGRGYFPAKKAGELDVPKVLAWKPQSTAARMMLVALVRADRAGLDLLWTVHDELGVENGERVRLTLTDVMEAEHDELKWGCPVDIGEGRNWSEAKH